MNESRSSQADQVLEQLHAHPVAPPALSHIVAAGRRLRRRRVLGLVAAGLLMVSGTVTGAAALLDTNAPSKDIAAPSEQTSLLPLDCQSDRFSMGNIDVIPPASEEQARAENWPTTPGEVIERLREATLLADLQIADFSDGITVTLANGERAVEYRGFADGSTVAVVTVQELLPGFWSATRIARCA